MGESKWGTHYFYCVVCLHEVVPTWRDGIFHHYDKRQSKECDHECEKDLKIEVSRVAPLEWLALHANHAERASHSVKW